MNLIRTAIERPIAVIAAVLMVVMFGLVALRTIPIQLAPDVNRPVITVATNWPGAAPVEVEREITNEQEDVLKGLKGLGKITGRAQTGRSEVTLEFDVGTNMDRALLLTANRLDRVSGYPDEADEPTLDTAGSDDSPIGWFVIRRVAGNEQPIQEYGDFIEEIVKDRIERVAGVSRVAYFGASEREIQVTVEPRLLANHRLTVTGVVRALRAANASVSAGDVEEGKRRYVVRTEGALNSPEQIRQVVVRSDGGRGTGRLARVTVGDIATVGYGYKDPTASIRFLGEPAIAFNAQRETGANVIETMAGIKAALAALEAGPIPDNGLTLRQVYDETVYINSSIDLVRQNIWVGGTLAAVILLLFLRSGRATLAVSLSIPVSVIGAFVAMAALGRSINVISLAGLAFAVGMVVDAAIVVLENIFRLREGGKSAREAAYEGARQVWGAIFVSAMTTVMVFIPILVMQLEVGQLFRDIAVAISVAVVLSLIVSITVLPALSCFLLGDGVTGGKGITRVGIPLIDGFAKAFVAFAMGFVRGVVRGKALAFAVVGGTTAAACVCAWLFLPKLEYLPEGNRNLVFASMLPPPGYNLDTMTEIADRVEGATKPLWGAGDGDGAGDGASQPPRIDRFFFVATRAVAFFGAAAVEPRRAGELIPILKRPMDAEPGTFGFVRQLSLFGRGLGGARSVEIDISGADLGQILDVAGRAIRKVLRVMPLAEGHQVRPNPGLELGAPEIRVFPDRLRLADNGVTARELADTVDTFNDGLRVAEVTEGSKQIDLVLRGPDRNVVETQGIANLPVVTAGGEILPASSLADIVLTGGPAEIRHRERVRTVTLEVSPAASFPLEAAIETLQEDVMDALVAEGVPPGVTLNLSGTADKLAQTWDAMVLDLLLALVIVYLVMAVLFESFAYPLIIMLAVPIAAAGGVLGLKVLNVFVPQPLDMLTLLGFVILIGIVVNNAILLVHRTLYHLREQGMSAGDAILEATRNRIRPIFMSTLTSVAGMLPLVLFPGAGSELYRGLGSVVVGGLALSALLTLLIVPPMLTVLVGALEGSDRFDLRFWRRGKATGHLVPPKPRPAPGE